MAGILHVFIEELSASAAKLGRAPRRRTETFGDHTERLAAVVVAEIGDHLSGNFLRAASEIVIVKSKIPLYDVDQAGELRKCRLSQTPWMVVTAWLRVDPGLNFPAKAWRTEDPVRRCFRPGVVFDLSPAAHEVTKLHLRGRGAGGMKLRENPARIKPGWDRLEARASAVAAPRPLSRRLDETAANRIEREVARKFEQMSLSLNRLRVESMLKEVSDATMNRVEPSRVNAEQIAHAIRQVRHGCRQQEVEMIRHQHPRMKSPATLKNDLRQGFDERFAVSVGPDNVFLFVPAAGYVKE